MYWKRYRLIDYSYYARKEISCRVTKGLSNFLVFFSFRPLDKVVNLVTNLFDNFVTLKNAASLMP